LFGRKNMGCERFSSLRRKWYIRKERRMSATWPRFSGLETRRTASTERLFRAMPNLSAPDQIRADTGICSAWRRDGLCDYQAGSGKTGAELGKASWHPHGSVALF